MQTQREIELEAYGYGKDRMTKTIANNEEKGRAASNPYAQAIYRRFVLPLSQRIQEDLTTVRPGRNKAHVALIRGMDIDAAAAVAVRAVIGSLLSGQMQKGRDVIAAVGKAVYHEHLLANFEDMNAELFHTLTEDFDRKFTKNERHRMTVYKMQAEKNGLRLPEWGMADRDQVGSYVCHQLCELGMLEKTNHTVTAKGKTNTHIMLEFTPEIIDLIDQIKEFVAENTPYYYPCVEPPRPWTSFNEGGFHTEEMRRMMPYCVKTFPGARDVLRQADLSTELSCLNSLQATPWRINGKMLDVIHRVSDHFDMEEILTQGELPRPAKPDFLQDGADSAMWEEDQQAEFKRWKREMAAWYTSMKERGVKWGRFYNALRVARKFRDYSRLHFVYFMDFRGRKYVQSTGVSPQGSDMQKALLEFAEGKPLLTKEAKDWFLITGANRWGYDKETLPDRVKWAHDHHQQIMGFASDPIAHSDWKDADKPLQFLAWCFEYAEWQVLKDKFLSRISVGMDGSCNGLQNFSAMLRDEIGGLATNLVPAPKPNDIYSMVAVRTATLLLLAPEDAAGYRSKWIAHGLTRDLVKRSVMTLPYGSRQSSCADFIAGDYLAKRRFPELAKPEYGPASRYLAKFVWSAIGDVVVKAREAMVWLQKATSVILKGTSSDIQWVTPSGFRVVQTYWEADETRIRTHLGGPVSIMVKRETDRPDKNRHRNGIAPNFVHSLDACHLTLTTNACAARGIEAFHMVHDDFGTHAADAQAMYEAIRTEFVGMYEAVDPLAEFHETYPALGPRPELGSLDIRQVIDSPFFFS